jgi:hypothetical protein
MPSMWKRLGVTFGDTTEVGATSPCTVAIAGEEADALP